MVICWNVKRSQNGKGLINLFNKRLFLVINDSPMFIIVFLEQVMNGSD